MTNYEVNYELTVSFSYSEESGDDEKDALELFHRHGLEQFLSSTPSCLLERPVIEFFQSLNKNAETGAVTASVTLTLADGASARLDIDVREALRSTFNLPNSGDLVSSIANADISAAMATAISAGKTTGTLRIVNFLSLPKFVLKIVKESLLGMLGSRNQVSLPQQRVLTALLSTEVAWNWEEHFVNALVDARKSTKLRLGSKVSAIILKAAEGSSATWPSSMAFNLSPIVARSKKAALKGRLSHSSSQLNIINYSLPTFSQPPLPIQPPKPKPLSLHLPTSQNNQPAGYVFLAPLLQPLLLLPPKPSL